MNTTTPPPASGYDALLTLSERSTIHGAALDPLLTTISQILNGGCEQLASNRHTDEAKCALLSLRASTAPKTREFLDLLASAMADMADYEEAFNGRRMREMDDTEAEEFATAHFGTGTACDQLENWLYDDASAEAFYREIIAHFTA